MNETKEMTATAPVKDIVLGTNIFHGYQEFQVAQRMAQALASSTIVPKEYHDNLGNCIIALEMANRLSTSPMMVMQNLYIVNGRPAWSSQYIIAMINASKKYKTELQFDLTGSGKTMACTAWAEDYNGHKVTGPTITMEMAEDEGWTTRNGSKWKTMPEVMIRYRAASFFGRLNCPDMIMGIYSTDEAVEIGPDEYREIDPAQRVQEEIKEKANGVPIDISMDPKTGEVLNEKGSVSKDDPEPLAEPSSAPQEPPKESPRETTPPTDRKPSEAEYTPGF
jgi:hypothetical protein